MTTAEMLQKIQLSLATDPELVGYCVDALGSVPTIQIDFDEEQELDLDCYPFIGLLAPGHTGDIHRRENRFDLHVIVAVRKSDISTQGHSVPLTDRTVQSKTRTYTGRLQAEDLREQTIAALYRGRLGKISVDSKPFEHTHYPKFYSPFTVIIEERI